MALRTGRVLVLKEFLPAVPRFARWGNGRDSSTSACGAITNPGRSIYAGGVVHVCKVSWSSTRVAAVLGSGLGWMFQGCLSVEYGNPLDGRRGRYNIVVYVPSVLELTDITVMWTRGSVRHLPQKFGRRARRSSSSVRDCISLSMSTVRCTWTSTHLVEPRRQARPSPR